MSGKACIVWFRRDLRLADNPALAHAVQSGYRVMPVYIDDPQSELPWASGAASRSWLHHSLSSLNASFNTRGNRLILRSGDSLENLAQLVKECRADAVFWNRVYEPTALARDAVIRQTLKGLGVNSQTFKGNLLAEPWEFLNQSGKPFQVFTPYWRHHCKTVLVDATIPAPKTIPSIASKTLSGEALEALGLLPNRPWDTRFYHVFSPGERGALDALNRFTENDGAERYESDRNRPDLTGTSMLSPHLHFGEISVRHVFNALSRKSKVVDSSTSVFLSELGWREFAHHLLYHFPHTTEQPLKTKFASFPWEDDESVIDRWTKGMTGIPIVDAGMRQLWATGWMHNRVRMIVASFLVKNLMIPWQKGARWFWDTLVDADLASNTLGWQWVAGCGADAAPYFRIFNPVLQSQKFDPHGKYLLRWIPELKDFPGRMLHCPWRSPDLLKQTGYPEKMVSLVESRSRALAAYEALPT